MLNLNDQSCPFCNGDKLLRYQAPAHDAQHEQVHIVACQSCQAGWQWPLRRSEQQSAVAFENAYAEHDEGSYFDQKKRQTVAACQLEFIHARCPHAGRLLDIGCGDASFARPMAQRGWDVVGLDPALTRSVTEEFAPGRLSLQCHSVAELPAAQLFDLITLWDVVEHVERPDELLQQAAAHLAPSGILIAETGNYQSAQRILSQGRWWNYQLDHRWYFAPPQLEALLRQAGLQHIELADKVLRPWWTGAREMPRPRLRSLIKAIAKKPWKFSSALGVHQALVVGKQQWTGWGGLEIMTMIGRKSPAADTLPVEQSCADGRAVETEG